MPISRIIAFTLAWEGGDKITKDPHDPGGVTKYGISQRAHPEVNVEALTISQAMEIYKDQYWDKVAEGKDDNLDCCAFDTAVNCGNSRVLKWLKDCQSWEDMIRHRRQHYKSIIEKHPSLSRYQKGWENRVVALEGFIRRA